MKNIKKIAIIGVGFMGGSLSLALRRKFPQVSVWGYARSQRSYHKLKKLRILNKVERNLNRVVDKADLVVLALPVEAIIEYLKKISPFLKEGAIVFDLGSSKELIVKAARRYLSKRVNFVGCHPLAGSEKSGAQFSRQNLYQGTLCLITSSRQRKATKTIKHLWEKLGSRVLFVDFRQHDRILSSVSHLPHLVAFSLVQLVPDESLKLSSSSFKDLTRIANSPSSVWVDIFISNKRNILKNLDKFIKILKNYAALLKNDKRKSIISLINKANIKQKRIQ